MIRTVWWQDQAVYLIDQQALPQEERILVCRDYREVIRAIKDLTVRGAPAIGVAAALGIALGAQGIDLPEDFDRQFGIICDEFAQARPTARNLFWAIERMKGFSGELQDVPLAQKKGALLKEAINIGEEDIANNRRLGINGQVLIAHGDQILTHCNAGALATAGYGTALGIIRAAREAGKPLHVYACETRPVLQGARLTAWELMKENIPVTLITDNMAGFLMSQGKIDCVIVGADRIALNGDVANKIGTYSLAVLARENRIPFYVAAPLSTFDQAMASGSEIPIEERPAHEILAIRGVSVAPAGVSVYNPAFDITPHSLITAIITEAGIIRKLGTLISPQNN